MYRSSLHFLSLAYKTPKNGGVVVNLLNQTNGQQRHSSNGEFSCKFSSKEVGFHILDSFSL